jgi:hypothetical protein
MVQGNRCALRGFLNPVRKNKPRRITPARLSQKV